MSIARQIMGNKVQEADQQGPYVVKAGPPVGWRRPKEGVQVVVKTTEPRGVHAQTILNLAHTIAGRNAMTKAAGITNSWTLSGMSLKDAANFRNYQTFKPAGVVLGFPTGTPEDQAVAAAQQVLAACVAKAERSAAATERHRAEAPGRRKETSKFYHQQYAQDRQALYDEYGKRNVDSVTARQIGGDDGYQWNVLINGRPIINGLTQGEVAYYKRKAYADLLVQNGKV